jgi:hypothetical protein
MLHYKACAHTWRQKAADIALGVFGVVATIYTTTQTIIVSVFATYRQQHGSSDEPVAHDATEISCFTHWEV